MAQPFKPACFSNLFTKPSPNPFGVRHADVPAALRMAGDIGTVPAAAKHPTLGLQPFDEL